jgi:hypothetical protein
MNSKTLQGAIISGPYGNEYTVEREAGVITWTNEIPRFNSRPGLFRDSLWEELRIDGIRNPTILVAFDIIDYQAFTKILKDTLLFILAALALSLLTMIFSSLLGKTSGSAPAVDFDEPRSFAFTGSARIRGLKKEAPERTEPALAEAGPESPPAAQAAAEPEKPGPAGPEPAQAAQSEPVHAEPEQATRPEWEAEAAGPAPARPAEGPKGLYTSHGNISWEAYTKERLASELHRCAAFEQDLVFIVMEFTNIGNVVDSFFNTFTEAAVKYFTLRDLIFEWGWNGISVIIPNIDLDQGFSKAEEFHSRVRSQFGAFFAEASDLSIGLSSRAGRLIDAERLMFESSQALIKAAADPVSSIVAFRSDPEKYRAFIAAQGKE